MSIAWTAAEAVAATGGRLAGPGDWQAMGVSIDSRTVAPGDLFIALAGPKFDGHDYIAAALERGAVAALVHRRPQGLAGDAPLLIVADTLAALKALGRAARQRTAAIVVAVTGSVGKTGTKEALRRAFERQGRTAASVGSLNNHWGVPLTLARVPQDAAYAVIEIGMNHPGEIDALTRMARPDVAVITTIEPAHVEFFDSIEAIADAKAEIFEGMGPRGAAILNRDNPHYARLAAAAEARGITRILGFGEQAGAAIRLLGCELEAMSSEVRVEILGRDRRLLHRQPGPPLGDEQPRRARRGEGGGRRCRRSGRGAGRERAAGRARQAPQDRGARRHRRPDRRELQRQPRLDARRLRRARRQHARQRRPPHRRAGRHAGARRGLGAPPRRSRGADRCGPR